MKLYKNKEGMLYEHLDLAEMQERNHRAGFHWFEEGTTRFFRTRYGSTVFPGNYFVTGDAKGFRDNDGRGFTVRKFHSSTGDVDTVGEFNQYATRKQAERVAEKLSHAESVGIWEKQEREHAFARLTEWVSWEQGELDKMRGELALIAPRKEEQEAA